MTDTGIDNAQQLAMALQRVLEAAHSSLSANSRPSALVEKVTGHLGVPLAEVVAVSQSFPPWEHVNLQRGADVYLSEPEWFGMSGHGPDHEDFLNILTNAGRHSMFELGKARFGTAPTGPETSTEVVELGLVCAASPGGDPVVIGLRTGGDFSPACRIDVLAASGQAAAETRDEVVRLMRVHDVFRRQVLSFGESEHHGNELVTFLPRLTVTADDVILPDGVLDLIERHVVEVAEWSAELLAAGQHLKRGLLLHGPPGTGKTHTVRYLISSLEHCTVILLTGPAMRFIDQAAALARRLQPSLVVLEDVDLVATDRDFEGDNGRPLLFSLLDAMDGIGGDADVSFVLTTNRARVLEKALAERPGRVDLAVEIPRPDATGRARLLALYGRDLEIQADHAPIVAATEGVTASYIKELVRRAVLTALRETGTTVLRDHHFATANTEMTHANQQLTAPSSVWTPAKTKPNTGTTTDRDGRRPAAVRNALARGDRRLARQGTYRLSGQPRGDRRPGRGRDSLTDQALGFWLRHVESAGEQQAIRFGHPAPRVDDALASRDVTRAGRSARR